MLVDVLRFTDRGVRRDRVRRDRAPLPLGRRRRRRSRPTGACSPGCARRGPSLSPTDLLTGSGTRLVLPSPNGAALAVRRRRARRPPRARRLPAQRDGDRPGALTLAGAGAIALVAAGERWHGATGPLRPGVEDLLGAGAVLAALDPASVDLPPRLLAGGGGGPGRVVAARPRLAPSSSCDPPSAAAELVARGWADDVNTSAAYDVTDLAAQLVDGAFVAV